MAANKAANAAVIEIDDGASSEETNGRLGYEDTVMYGRYSRDLGEFAKSESHRLRELERLRKREQVMRRKELLPYRGKWTRRAIKMLGYVWKRTFARIGEDWVFLAVLGIFMALISFIMDYGIAMCNKARIWLYRDLTTHPVLQYMAWVTLPVSLILFSAGFVHIVSRSAVGSGIPEMKTILRGVPLDEYLTLRTLIAKVVGLTACLGSGMPLGKEGPFVHIASIVATLLSKLVTSFKGIYENESRNSEMLASACAVGVACSFAAPIGGVLFSIEVTSVYFAVRNYWRGFFAAVCGAMVFRLLAVWFNDEETITALFKTDFTVDFPFDPYELFVFAMIGAAAGFAGAFFVWVHRRYVVFMRNNACMKGFLQQNRYLYPFIVSLLISSATFPLGLGQFLAADQTTHDQVAELFSNFTWSSENLAIDQAEMVDHWTNPFTGFYINLCIYIFTTFCTAVVASTLPVPSGIFIPVFKMGAAFGRLVGECMAMWYPKGVRYGGHISHIMPGGYSIVGAAALAGSVTQTISTSVIVFELTGQITHILPVMIAVLIANAVSQLLQPSIYDSIIQIKKLPYLPDILTSTNAYSIYVEDIMVRDIKYIWHGITYRQLRQILIENRKLSTVPLVDSHASMILLGSVKRKQLVLLLEQHLSADRRIEVVSKWQRAAHKVRLVQHGSSWKELVALARVDHTQELLRRRKSAELQQLSIDTAPEVSPQLSGADDDMIAVSGARVATPEFNPASEGHVDNASTSQPPAASQLAVRRQSRFAVTPVTAPTETGDQSEPEAKNDDAVSKQSVTSTGSNMLTEREVMSDADPSAGSETDASQPAEVSLAKDHSHILTPRVAISPADDVSPEPKRVGSLSSLLTLPSSRPLKPILKKMNSFTLVGRGAGDTSLPYSPPSFQLGNYATVTGGGDGRLRSAFERVLQKTRELKESSRAQNGGSFSFTQKNTGSPVAKQQDMTYEDQKKWEEEELDKPVNFDVCKIDPAPFQLVERTTLLKVHSLFSMLGLNHAYVTAIGRLIGVVALKELRSGILRANHSTPTKTDEDDKEQTGSKSSFGESSSSTEMEVPEHAVTLPKLPTSSGVCRV